MAIGPILGASAIATSLNVVEGNVCRWPRKNNPLRATDDNALHAVLVPTAWRCGVLFLKMVDIARDRRAASFWPLVQ